MYAHASQWDIHLCANFLLLVQENITPPCWLTKLNLESDSSLSSSATLKGYLEVLLNMIFELHMTISSTKYFAFQLIKAKLAYFTLRRDFLACVQKNKQFCLSVCMWEWVCVWVCVGQQNEEGGASCMQELLLA